MGTSSSWLKSTATCATVRVRVRGAPHPNPNPNPTPNPNPNPNPYPNRLTLKVALVAMGRLKNHGHQFNYSGHLLKLGTLA